MAHPKVAQFSAWLVSRGMRPTPQRLHVAHVLLSHAGHLTSDEFVVRARATMPKLGVSTVWRTLALLVEAGLADRQRFGGISRYEPSEEHHDHIVCLARAQPAT